MAQQSPAANYEYHDQHHASAAACCPRLRCGTRGDVLGRGTHPTVNDVAEEVYNRARGVAVVLRLRFHPQPHPPRRLWALFLLLCPGPPATYQSQRACRSAPAASFDPPSTVTSPARPSYSPSPTTGTCSTCSVACDVRRIADGSAHRCQRAREAAALAGPTRRHPGAASAATHERIFRLRAPMANLPVHPPRTADYQGHAAGGEKKGGRWA
ncbi:hypothetical protein B0H14DRAFT_3871428 [Mycena olivaceomarginata]|nr:hypothetical protein B0H14DRAFT_3871428 [Mycena olivaceomarginata]